MVGIRRHYYAGATAMIFVVDSADVERLGEYKFKDAPSDPTKSYLFPHSTSPFLP